MALISEITETFFSECEISMAKAGQNSTYNPAQVTFIRISFSGSSKFQTFFGNFTTKITCTILFGATIKVHSET